MSVHIRAGDEIRVTRLPHTGSIEVDFGPDTSVFFFDDQDLVRLAQTIESFIRKERNLATEKMADKPERFDRTFRMI